MIEKIQEQVDAALWLIERGYNPDGVYKLLGQTCIELLTRPTREKDRKHYPSYAKRYARRHNPASRREYNTNYQRARRARLKTQGE